MKFLFALLLLILGLYVVGFFLPQNYEVSRTRVLAATKADIHRYVEDLHTWPEWSAFKPPAQDGQETVSEFHGASKGEGAIWKWGGLGDIKPAQLEILASQEERGIEYSLALDGGRVETAGELRYVEVDGGIEVTMTNTGSMASPWKRYFNFLADKSIGPTLEGSLQGLEQHLQGSATPQAAPAEDSASEPHDADPGADPEVDTDRDSDA